MRKYLLFLSLLLSFSLFSYAQDYELSYTLTPANGSNNSYTGNCDINIGGITWNLTGNSQMNPWRIGGKSLTNVDRTLYSKTAIQDNIAKVEVELGAMSSITLNSLKFIVSKNSDFSSPIYTKDDKPSANSTFTVTKPAGQDWSKCYYKFIFNVTVSDSSNKFIEFKSAKFYTEKNSGVTPPLTPPTFAINGTNVSGNVDAKVGDILTILPEGADILYTDNGKNPSVELENDEQLYEGPIEFTQEGNFTYRAIVYDLEDNASDVATLEVNVTANTQGGGNTGGGDTGEMENVTATVVMDSQSDLIYADGKTITWKSSDGKYEFSTIATITGQNYPTKSGTNLRIYNSNGNTITVNAPEGTYFVTLSAALGTPANKVAINGKTVDNNQVFTFEDKATSFALTSVASNNNNKNSDVASMTFDLAVPKTGGETPEPDVPVSPELKWSKDAVEMTFGDTVEWPELSHADGVTGITYSSSDEKVATISTDGKVEVLGVGTTTITASFTGDGVNFTDGKAEYTLTVTEPVVEPEPGENTIAMFDFTQANTIKEIMPDITLPATKSSGTAVNDKEFRKSGVSIATSKGSNNDAVIWLTTTENVYQYRIYKGAKMTIKSSSNITKVEFAGGNNYVGSDHITPNVGTLSKANNNNATWTGNAKEIVFTVGDSQNPQINTITVTYEGSAGAEPKSPELKWSKNAVEMTFGDTVEWPELSHADGVTGITYSSSDEKVATISTDGKVEVHGVGKTTITASYEGDGVNFTDGKAEYTLTVNKKADEPAPTEGETELTADNMEVKGTYALYEKTDEFGFTYSTFASLQSSAIQINGGYSTNGKVCGFAVTGTNPEYEIESIDIEFGTTINGLDIYSSSVEFEYDGNAAIDTEFATQVETNLKENKKGIAINDNAFAIIPNANNRIAKITVHYVKNDDNRIKPTFKWSVSEFSVELGDENVEWPTLDKSEGITGVKYTSSHPEVATISPEGVVTPVAKGETNIIAEFDGDETYRPAITEYTLTVTKTEVPEPTSNEYKLLTSLDQIGKTARIIIVDKDVKKAISTNQQNNNRKATDVTLDEDGLVRPGSNVSIITLTDEDEADFTFYAPYVSNNEEKGGYLYPVYNNNYLRTQDAKYNATIEINEDAIATIKFVAANNSGTTENRYLKYNSGSDLFSCYTGGQTDVMIYVNVLDYIEPLPVPELKWMLGDQVLEEGETVTYDLNPAVENTLPTLVYPEEGIDEVLYYSSDENVAKFGDDNTLEVLKKGKTKITGYTGVTDIYEEAEVTYILDVIDTTPLEEFTDVINVPNLWENQPNASGYTEGVYTPHNISYTWTMNRTSANGNMQINPSAKDVPLVTEKSSGIVVTANPEGFVVDNITVEWAGSTSGNTNENKTLAIYGLENTLYNGTADLKALESRGIGFASTAYNNDELTAEFDATTFAQDSYDALAFTSANNAVYIKEIRIHWVKPAAKDYVALDGYATDGVKFNYGETGQLNLGYTHPELSFETPDAVNVDETGLVTATEAGEFKVTASWNGVENRWNEGSAEFMVTVVGREYVPELKDRYTVAEKDVLDLSSVLSGDDVPENITLTVTEGDEHIEVTSEDGTYSIKGVLKGDAKVRVDWSGKTWTAGSKEFDVVVKADPYVLYRGELVTSEDELVPNNLYVIVGYNQAQNNYEALVAKVDEDAEQGNYFEVVVAEINPVKDRGEEYIQVKLDSSIAAIRLEKDGDNWYMNANGLKEDNPQYIQNKRIESKGGNRVGLTTERTEDTRVKISFVENSTTNDIKTVFEYSQGNEGVQSHLKYYAYTQSESSNLTSRFNFYAPENTSQTHPYLYRLYLTDDEELSVEGEWKVSNNKVVDPGTFGYETATANKLGLELSMSKPNAKEFIVGLGQHTWTVEADAEGHGRLELDYIDYALKGEYVTVRYITNDNQEKSIRFYTDDMEKDEKADISGKDKKYNENVGFNAETNDYQFVPDTYNEDTHEVTFKLVINYNHADSHDAYANSDYSVNYSLNKDDMVFTYDREHDQATIYGIATFEAEVGSSAEELAGKINDKRVRDLKANVQLLFPFVYLDQPVATQAVAMYADNAFNTDTFNTGVAEHDIDALTANDDVTTGVEDVEVEILHGGNEAYYNLQGVRVVNPLPGQVYIRVAGRTATKVVIE